MQKIIDYRFAYRGFWDCEAVCHFRVYEAPDQPTVVILTELPENEGTVITLLFEALATQVFALLERPARGVIWIENYPPEISIGWKETWEQVTFDQEGNPFRHPVRSPLTRAEVESLIGQLVETVRR